MVSLGFLAALTSSPASCLRLMTLRSGIVGAGTAGTRGSGVGEGVGLGVVSLERRWARSRAARLSAVGDGMGADAGVAGVGFG